MLRVPADADRSLERVSAEVQTLLQIPVVVSHSPQLDCRESRLVTIVLFSNSCVTGSYMISTETRGFKRCRLDSEDFCS